MNHQKLLLSASLDEFAQVIAHVIEQIVQHYLAQHKPQKEEAYLSRTQTAKRLDISLVTLHTWTLQGKLHAHKPAGSSKVYYSEKEVLSLIASSKKTVGYES
jgi:hypothetical protein